MKNILLLLFITHALSATCQPSNARQLAEPIVEEGRSLYYIEMTAAMGETIFKNTYNGSEAFRSLAYLDKNKGKCIFYSGPDQSEVICTISFSGGFARENATISMKRRQLSREEQEIRDACDSVYKLLKTDTLFTAYQDTRFEVIPMMSRKQKKVYVLTMPAEDETIIFGNDYLIGFDESGQVSYKKKLHRGIMPVFYGSRAKDEDPQTTGKIHTHLPEDGEFINATDICTLMLFEKNARWKSHVVVSRHYTSIWNCESNTLVILNTPAD